MIKLTEKFWIDNQINPEFLDVIKKFTPSLSEENQHPVSIGKEKNIIFQLAYWCCKAVDADLQQADLITNVWILFQSAAELLDTIEDGDEKGELLNQYSQGELINISTSLILLAELILCELEVENNIDPAVANDLRRHFNRHILKMCGGQHLDLRNQETTLEEGWQITEAKTGEFFSLICYACARLGTDNIEILNKFQQFGHHYGTIVQIKDDITGLWDENTNKSDLTKSKYTLPVLYALDVLPDSQAELLRKQLEDPYPESTVAAARKMIIESGAVLYLSLEIEKRKLLAKSLLSETGCHENGLVYKQLVRTLNHVSSLAKENNIDN